MKPLKRREELKSIRVTVILFLRLRQTVSNVLVRINSRLDRGSRLIEMSKNGILEEVFVGNGLSSFHRYHFDW